MVVLAKHSITCCIDGFDDFLTRSPGAVKVNNHQSCFMVSNSSNHTLDVFGSMCNMIIASLTCHTFNFELNSLDLRSIQYGLVFTIIRVENVGKIWKGQHYNCKYSYNSQKSP